MKKKKNEVKVRVFNNYFCCNVDKCATAHKQSFYYHTKENHDAMKDLHVDCMARSTPLELRNSLCLSFF